MSAEGAIATHEASGREFEAGGVRSFVREQGDGEPVVLLHGVPVSSFLWRKVLPELAERGLRAVALDLPGLGLAERPRDFDYSWSGLGRFCAAATEALGLDRFHLAVHDIGGPVGFEVAVAAPERIRSLTVLNTVVAVASFRRPPPMKPYAVPGIGELALATLTRPAFRVLFRRIGLGDSSSVPAAEIDAHLELLRRGDRGRAFLKIMRGFELTRTKQQLYEGTLRDVPYPVGALWGADDPALKPSQAGEAVRRAAGLERLETVSAKHFLQEDRPAEVATAIAATAARA